MRKLVRRRALGAIIVAVALVAAACGDDSGGGDIPDGPDIIVGSFGFNESIILGEIYTQVLDDAGYPVSHKEGLGSREAAINPALRSGEINLVPEYVGSGLEVGFGIEPSADLATTLNALKAEWEKEGLTVLDATPAEDKNGFVVTAETASSLGLSKVSDLEGKTSDLTFGGPPECPERPRCIGGLYSVYGLDEFAEFKALDVGGPLTVEALAGGEIDVGLLFSSDGAIAARGFVLLDDDKGLQPAENIAPVIGQDVVDAYGNDLVDLLNRVSAKVTQEILTEMNRKANIDGDPAADVAAQFLRDEGFIGN